jgi:tripartite-type tricarboxylate transporter receptor subunit TctC
MAAVAASAAGLRTAQPRHTNATITRNKDKLLRFDMVCATQQTCHPNSSSLFHRRKPRGTASEGGKNCAPLVHAARERGAATLVYPAANVKRFSVIPRPKVEGSPYAWCLKRSLAALGMTILAAAATEAPAQTAAGSQAYPSHPLRLIVPFPPGGSTDILARALSQKLSENLGQAVVVDNRPGAGGSIGAEAAAKAAPDGYTLMMGQLGPLAVSPAIYRNLPYDPVKSFAPVSLMAIVPSVLVVNNSLPVSSAAELIAYAKKNPGRLTYGSAGTGSTSHLTTEYFKLATGTDILHIPYKGVGPMLTDLISGQLAMGINGAPAVMPHVNSGRLRALAVSSLTRLPSLPDIPTLDESGVKGFEANGWYGIVAPAGTPREIVARLNAEIRRIVATPELRARLDAEGAIPAADSPEAFAAFIASEIARWGAVLKRAGIEPQ